MASRRLSVDGLLFAASALAFATALTLVFLIAPREAVMGDLQRIFYFHVSSAWTGYLALLTAFVASILLLTQGHQRWDRLAHSSAEIGLVFITGGIVTGSMWAKATWGVWWTWEPRLTTSAVLWIIYASYLTLRRVIEEPHRKSRVAAVYGVLGFLAVPINFMAIRWWRTVHPLVFDSEGSHLSPTMLFVLIFSVLTFSLLYAVLLAIRVRIESVHDRLEQLKYR